MIGRIAYRREGDDGSAQSGRIYDCLVIYVVKLRQPSFAFALSSYQAASQQ